MIHTVYHANGIALTHDEHVIEIVTEYFTKDEIRDILWGLEVTNPHSEIREKIKTLLESYE